jgi:hypothetical protein
MSILKQLKWLLIDQFMFYTGGGGGGGATTSTGTTYTSNIPEYAKPYVMSMLGSAQQQIFNLDAAGNIESFKPYQAYSENVNDYFAASSPMQEQAYAGASNLQLPGQYQAGSELAGAGGLGSLGVAGQVGNTGNNYFGMATNPGAVNQFMNPYLQNALNPALDESRRQYGITGQQQQGQATQAGAFGGSREALMASENNRNMNTAMNQMIGQGYQNAYTDAQRNIFQGSQLGLQGQQAALQGYGQGIQAAGALGQLGQSQLQGQQNIINMQKQFGDAQQAGEQAKINQSIQDYATKQQYPMMQLANMNALLRGMPLENVSRQTYAPAASGAAQLGSLGAGAYGVAKMAGLAKEGGSTKDINSRAGIASYAVGGSVTSQGYKEGIAQGLNSKQLEKVQPRTLPDYIRIPLLNQKVQEEQAAKQAMGAQQGMQAQDPIKQQILAQAQELGIDSAQSNLPTESMAGGGIVAFARGGVNAPEFDYTPVDMDYKHLDEELEKTYNPVTKMPYTFKELAEQNKQRQTEAGINFGLYDEQKAELEGRKTLPESRSRFNEAMPFFALAERLGKAPQLGDSRITPFASGLAEYGRAKGAIDEKEEARQEKIRAELNQLGLAKNQFSANQYGMTDTEYKQSLKEAKDIRLKKGEGSNANIASRNAAKLEKAKAEYDYGKDIAKAKISAASSHNTDLRWLTNVKYQELIAGGAPETAATMAKASSVAADEMGKISGASRLGLDTSRATTEAAAKIETAFAASPVVKAAANMIQLQEMQPDGGNPAEIEKQNKKIEAERTKITNNVLRGLNPDGTSPTAAPKTTAPTAAPKSDAAPKPATNTVPLRAQKIVDGKAVIINSTDGGKTWKDANGKIYK